MVRTAAKRTLEVAEKLDEDHRNETFVHGVFLGVLAGLHRAVPQREAGVYLGHGRVDFRYPGAKATLVELVVRDPYHGNQLYGPGNQTELLKLCKQDHAKSSTRVLLLLDLSGESPHPKERLQASYDRVQKVSGRGVRKKVRILYVHPDFSYSFLWNPRW